MWISRLVILTVLLTACAAQDEPGVLDMAVNFIKQCGNQDMTVCVKERALRALENSEDVEITDGLTLKKDENVPQVPPVALPEEGRARESAIDNQLVDRFVDFMSSHTLQFKLPKSTSEDMKRSLEEARKKKKAKKLLLPLLLLLKLKAVLLLPIILGAIAFIAFKALIIGKIALVLSLISAIKKLLLSKGDHSSYEVVAHPQVSHSHISSFGDEHHGHGWAGRSDPQNLAYSAYAQN